MKNIYTYQDLINKINSFSTKEEKIKCLMPWFLTFVEYDYTTLEAAKIDAKDIYHIDETFNAESEEDRSQATEYMKTKLGYSSELIGRIIENYGKLFVIEAKPERIMFGRVYPAEPERVDTANFSNAVTRMEHPVLMSNGLIVKGVCADFSMFIKKVCDECGIDCAIVHGATTVGHVWNMIEGKHYDITYAMFVRDRFNDWHKKSTVSDWLNKYFEELLVLQPNRKMDM